MAPWVMSGMEFDMRNYVLLQRRHLRNLLNILRQSLFGVPFSLSPPVFIRISLQRVLLVM